MLKKILYIFLIAMVPIIELRGAIPVGARMGIPYYWNFLTSVLGNMLPVPFILLFIPAVLRFMKKHRIFPHLVEWVERKGQRGVEKLKQKENRSAEAATDSSLAEGNAGSAAGGESPSPMPERQAVTEKRTRKISLAVCLGLLAFVAIPLPGTGAWTGALVASLFGMKKRYAIPTILLGVLIAGAMMTLASYGVVAAFQFLL